MNLDLSIRDLVPSLSGNSGSEGHNGEALDGNHFGGKLGFEVVLKRVGKGTIDNRNFFYLKKKATKDFIKSESFFGLVRIRSDSGFFWICGSREVGRRFCE